MLFRSIEHGTNESIFYTAEIRTDRYSIPIISNSYYKNIQDTADEINEFFLYSKESSITFTLPKKSKRTTHLVDWSKESH